MRRDRNATCVWELAQVVTCDRRAIRRTRIGWLCEEHYWVERTVPDLPCHCQTLHSTESNDD